MSYPKLPYIYRTFSEAHRKQAQAVNYALKDAGSDYPHVSVSFPGVDVSLRVLAQAANSLLSGNSVRVSNRLEPLEGYRRIAAAINSVL